jgi:hypothetical protein
MLKWLENHIDRISNRNFPVIQLKNAHHTFLVLLQFSWRRGFEDLCASGVFKGPRVQAFVLQRFYQRFEKNTGASGHGGLFLKGPHGLLASGPSGLRCQGVSFFSLEYARGVQVLGSLTP